MGDELKSIGRSFRPVLIVLPLGLLVIAVLFDVADFVGGSTFFGDVGYWNLSAGVICAGLAAAAGLRDLFVLDMHSAERRVATRNSQIHIWSVVMLAMAWLARSGTDHHSTGATLFIVELCAFAGVGFAMWHGSPLAWRGAVAREAPAPVDEVTVEISAFLSRP